MTILPCTIYDEISFKTITRVTTVCLCNVSIKERIRVRMERLCFRLLSSQFCCHTGTANLAESTSIEKTSKILQRKRNKRDFEQSGKGVRSES